MRYSTVPPEEKLLGFRSVRAPIDADKQPVGALAALMGKQDGFYDHIEESECAEAQAEANNRLDPETLEATTFLFLRWFGKALSRWLQGVRPSLVQSPGVLLQSPPESYANLVKDVSRLLSTGAAKRAPRWFVRLEKLQMWVKAGAEEVHVSGGRVQVGETYRPYALLLNDVDADGAYRLGRLLEDSGVVAPPEISKSQRSMARVRSYWRGLTSLCGE